ncbi:MAG: AraC family transcriptional regulator [Spirochaetales bacterium]
MNQPDIMQMYGTHTKTVNKSQERAVYITTQDTGSGTIEQYEIFNGVNLYKMDFFVESIDYTGTEKNYSDDFICINHCEKGRFEAEFQNGQFVYLGEKDVSLNAPENSPIKNSFPLGRFLGILIVIEVKTAQQSIKNLASLYGDMPIDFEKIKDSLREGNKFIVYRNSCILADICEKLYEKNGNNHMFLLKHTVLELLYRLSAGDIMSSTPSHYFLKQQVQKIKKIREFLTCNIDTRYSTKELSQKFDIALTSLKECFKEVYGMPISSYVRKYRISLAQNMLTETPLSIGDISDKIGYENQSKFAQAFKKTTGMTPIEYRNKKNNSMD